MPSITVTPSYPSPYDDDTRKYNDFVTAFTTSDNIHNSRELVKQFLMIDTGGVIDCDYAVTDPRGYTPLMVVAEFASSDFTIGDLQYLISRGHDTLRNRDGFTALMLAAKYSGSVSSEEAVRELLDTHSSPDIRSRNGKTALMYAAQYAEDYSTEETVKMLLRAGADPTLRDDDGQTAFDLAQTDAVRELLRVDPSETNVLTNFALEQWEVGDTFRVLLARSTSSDSEETQDELTSIRIVEGDMSEFEVSMKVGATVDTPSGDAISILTSISLDEWVEGDTFRVLLEHSTSDGSRNTEVLATIRVEEGDTDKVVLYMMHMDMWEHEDPLE